MNKKIPLLEERDKINSRTELSYCAEPESASCAGNTTTQTTREGKCRHAADKWKGARNFRSREIVGEGGIGKSGGYSKSGVIDGDDRAN